MKLTRRGKKYLIAGYVIATIICFLSNSEHIGLNVSTAMLGAFYACVYALILYFGNIVRKRKLSRTNAYLENMKIEK